MLLANKCRQPETRSEVLGFKHQDFDDSSRIRWAVGTRHFLVRKEVQGVGQ